MTDQFLHFCTIEDAQLAVVTRDCAVCHGVKYHYMAVYRVNFIAMVSALCSQLSRYWQLTETVYRDLMPWCEVRVTLHHEEVVWWT